MFTPLVAKEVILKGKRMMEKMACDDWKWFPGMHFLMKRELLFYATQHLGTIPITAKRLHGKGRLRWSQLGLTHLKHYYRK